MTKDSSCQRVENPLILALSSEDAAGSSGYLIALDLDNISHIPCSSRNHICADAFSSFCSTAFIIR
jgi:hypothetical protein